MNGQIWIYWDPRVLTIKVVEEHAQAIHCEMMDVKSGQLQYFFAVYALNTNEQRKELWSFITRQYQQTSLPMLMGGDFCHPIP